MGPRTGREHALDEILDVAENDSVSVRSVLLACQRLDLHALQYGLGDIAVGIVCGIEYSAAKKSVRGQNKICRSGASITSRNLG